MTLSAVIVHEIEVPFSGWWFLAAGAVACALLFAAIKWRNHILSAGAALFLCLGLLTGTAMLIDAGTIVSMDIVTGERGNPWRSVVTLWIADRGVLLTWETNYSSDAWRYDQHFYWEGWMATGTVPHYPHPSNDLTLVKSDLLRNKLGFDLAWYDGPYPFRGRPPELHEHTLVVPQWFVLLFCIPAPALFIRRCLKKRKVARWIAAGKCGHCGFDLRAHAPGTKCPECGTLVPGRRVASPTPPATFARKPHSPS